MEDGKMEDANAVQMQMQMQEEEMQSESYIWYDTVYEVKWRMIWYLSLWLSTLISK